jgi:ribosomal protein L11 methyltransferase
MNAYQVKFETKIIAQQNWNEEWEKNFDPTVVENLLAIKAPFHHQVFNTTHTIIIEPKMSFGTGHHATTWMMCKLMADFDFAEASVLDYGCGTGILAIYAGMLGASDIIAVDIDEWAYENTIENAERNNVSGITAIRGDINSVPERKYDFVFANINLNVLKKDIPFLASCMNKASIIFFSGFLNNELPQIEKVCADNGLFFVKDLQKITGLPVYLKSRKMKKLIALSIFAFSTFCLMAQVFPVEPDKFIKTFNQELGYTAK